MISVRNIGRYTLLLPILVAMPLGAEEAIKMEGMSVIGNKESPNLLYIVPWKSPEIPDIDSTNNILEPFGSPDQQPATD